jgi:hypothetical protein
MWRHLLLGRVQLGTIFTLTQRAGSGLLLVVETRAPKLPAAISDFRSA